MTKERPITSVCFTFENCDGYEFDASYFGKFRLDNITSSYIKRGDSIEFTESFSGFIISLHHSANVLFQNEKIFERIIRQNNITWITLNFKPFINKITLLAPWDERNEYKNSYQTSRLNKRGDLFITISKKFINLGDIDDKYTFEKFPCEQIKSANKNKIENKLESPIEKLDYDSSIISSCRREQGFVDCHCDNCVAEDYNDSIDDT